ncbi:unnamed protein product [Acanthoscelides obtectus]|uniref:U3 small nucleolar RNA-interacting protein 2 n=1 Tax=Acanthoscelides obtectus TaxID=200917 RepID=A0A9P0K8Y2_ACAOB|nr:unnamed protein product [Acanthoscelides obtectus]CAK1662376.1 U3 small nucleolar RNA-interacting protein 2 [Acanthoscelides obtectus]
MSFFIRNKNSSGGNSNKRAKFTKTNVKRKRVNGESSKNEEITSSEDEGPNDEIPDHSSDEEHETAQEKKLRLAKAYLEEIEKEEQARLESNEIDQSIISKRLKQDYLKETGRLRLNVADNYKSVDTENINILKCREQRNSITCMCVTSDSKFVFAGSADGVVVKYSLTDYKKVGVLPFVKNQSSAEIRGHGSKVYAVAVSSDSKFLVTADESQDIYIWDPANLKYVKKLSGHKNTVTGLCFKKDSHTLYSCSKDRTAKVWSLDEMAYVETLFGHQDTISSIDSLYRDRLVSCGGRDLRVWKIPEETQLIFNGHTGSIDTVRLINEDIFISGGDDGQLCIWSVMKKKPVCVIHNSHELDKSNQQPYWISAVAALVNTDLVASGSQNGSIRLWKLENNFKTSSLVMEIPVEGFVNAMSFNSEGDKLLAAIGKEHRFGRWSTVKAAKNCIMVFPFIKK